MSQSHIEIFTDIYENEVWGGTLPSEGSFRGNSGIGSSLEFNQKEYIPFLKSFIKNNNINSIIDLGCGDWRCGPSIYDDMANVSYVGIDAYQKIIERNKARYPRYHFVHMDVFNDMKTLLDGDLCIIKDVLQHWTNSEITKFLDVATTKYPLILICNCYTSGTEDVETTGGWRPMSAHDLPLSLYKPVVLLRYNTKEVCLIQSKRTE